ncbi:MAG TPA: hypothetical protein VD996_13955 [Chitinophagaceae bacterium]|nr:hypothetical protein [Chitinophagaceae bacterium]
MSNNLNILFIGQQEPMANGILSQFGSVSYNPAPSSYEGYDLVALDGSVYNGDFGQLFQTIWPTGTSIGVFNVSAAQVQIVADATGISPAGTAQGVLAAQGAINEDTFSQVRYLLQYPQAVLDVAAKGGISATDLINSYITAGIQAHFQALQQQSQPAAPGVAARGLGSGPGPTNNLIPTFSQVPFSRISLPAKQLTQSVPNMYNLSSVGLSISSQLYCYYENSNQDYIVIIVTQLNNVTNGNPLSYTQTEAPSCSSCVFNYEWDQFFDYNLQITAQNGSAQPIQSGLTIYDSSPANAGHGQTQLVDSLGVPNPFTIYLYVLNNGTWQTVNFPASYSNTITTPTVKWFDINSQNNQGNAIAGVDFNMPTNVTGGYLGDKSAQPVNFEVITAFKFAGSLVVNGALPVTFKFSVGMNITQNYTTLVSCGSPGWPQTTTTTCNGTQSFTTDVYDLVQLTKEQAPTK